MGFVIEVANNIGGLPVGYQQAINAAIGFFESTIANDITVRLSFTWSALATGSLAQNNSQYDGFTYAQVYGALQSVDGAASASSVQKAAAATLAETDPTTGGQFLLTAAEADALGLAPATGASEATITLNSRYAFSWSQAGGVAANTYDAVGALEHEISEALGRDAFLGALQPNENDKFANALPSYGVLDLFHYSAAGGASAAAPGAAAGPLDEPFVAGYSASVQGYFSYNGATVTLPFASPADVAAGIDAGDWSRSVDADAFGFAASGVVENSVSATDLQILNVLGYTEAPTPCFCKGARIATARGEVAVEETRIGDRVLLASGGERPIVWIGRRALDIRRHPEPRDVWPVCVRAQAFGKGLPHRDLWLSPGHNVAIGGVLMPIAALVNGQSIVQVQRDAIEYFHLELDAHDILLAEGLPAESYLDCGNRNGFSNSAAFIEAHPDFQPKHWAETCLPLVGQGPRVVEAKRRLIARLLARGFALTPEAEAHIVADDKTIAPMRLSPTRLGFVLPASAREIVLRSKTFVPAHTIATSSDDRELGLCVQRLQIDGQAVAPDGGAGWRDAEVGADGVSWRWTTGEASLPAGARVVVVDLAGQGFYWREPSEARVAVFR